MNAENPLRKTPRTTVRRMPARASYDRALAHAILDEALHASVGFSVGGQPYVVPMAYARDGDELVLHGSAASRVTEHGAAGVALCFTVTLVDGVVLARSAFHHSLNYRSVVVLGTAREITDVERKFRALNLLVEHVLRGRSSVVRPPSEREMRATTVLALPIDEASVKVRAGGPINDPGDERFPGWGGVVPLALAARAPVPDDGPFVELPRSVAEYRRARA